MWGFHFFFMKRNGRNEITGSVQRESIRGGRSGSGHGISRKNIEEHFPLRLRHTRRRKPSWICIWAAFPLSRRGLLKLGLGLCVAAQGAMARSSIASPLSQ